MQTYNGSANDTDVATSIDLDVYGIPYITGYSKRTGTNYDYCTVKYSSYDGSLLWQNFYNGGILNLNVSDKAYKIKVVSRGCATSSPGEDIPCWIVDAYITGSCDGGVSSFDYVTVHYAETGEMKWANRFNGSGTSSDAAFDISVMDGYPIVYSGGILNNNYGIVGITDSRQSPSDNIYINDKSGLSNCYPNPFNPETKIYFNLKSNSFVTLRIYDMTGREVTQLVKREFDKGTHSITWNATGSTSGVYFYKIETAFGSETKKIVLIK
jgi:hypothetical protein